VIPPGRGDPRIGSEYRALAEHLGVPAERFPMDVALTEADRARVQSQLAEWEVAGRYAVLCPFTTRPQKHWFDEHWRALMPLLRERAGLAAVILGGPGDAEHGDVLAAGEAANLAGGLSLRESAAAIAGASLLIGVDTGLTHMGTAYGIPTVALFGSTRPYLETDSPRTRVLYEPLWCSPCRRRPICGGVFSCMRLHRPEAVADVATGLMAEPTA
ncbi:MAG TPA: glycosyltransferase family 9 protein, partial [Gammaproteobacteria bacterium]|nr:glycosyltransferase family 9 protein [Gammaproteobacteria bacterium]